MADLEDFTGYTEADPNTRIGVTASRVTWAALTRDEDAYVYKDKTAGYFGGNFTIWFTYRATGYGGGTGTGRNGCWALTNTADDLKGIDDASGDFLTLLTYVSAGGDHQVYLQECDGGTIYTDVSANLTVNTDYYMAIVRNESVGTYGTLYCHIYSDVTRVTLVETLTLTLHSSKKDFQYIFGCISMDTNDVSLTHSGYTEALEIVSNISTPTVTTQACTSIVTTTATGNGTITDLAASNVTQHGHCWATTVDPTTADSKTENGAGSLGSFTSSITGLTPGLVYYVRAYATNGAGTAYGANVWFRAGFPSTQMEPGNIAVKTTTFRYVGRDGKEYYLQGTLV